MNSRQLQYALLLSEVRSFSQAAEKLNMSQPALSKQIISLEQEFGLKLFERTTPLSLTPAGEFFIKKARLLLFEEDQLFKTMERYKSGENGKLTIGISPFRSLYMMPELVKTLKTRYPGLKIVLSEYNSSILHKGIGEGLYDFAIMNLPIDDAELETIALEQDTLALALPETMLPLIQREQGDLTSPVNLADCANLPFIALSQGQEMRRLFDNLCTLAHLHPHITLEVVGMTTARTMVREGIGATLLPKQFVQSPVDAGIVLLPLLQSTYVRQPAVVLKRGQFISEYAKAAIELLTAHLNDTP